MNYLEVVKERNLDLADLPKTLQKKIQEIEALNAEFLKINIKKEKLKPAELENFNLIEEKIAELDAYLVKKVKIFDPAKYKARLDSFNSMMDKRKAAKKVEEPKEEKKEEATTESLAYLSKMLPVQENVQEVVQEPQPIYEQQEEDEFERKGAGNPRKMTTGLILMGVGAFFLTWGAVNFFKSRR